MYLNDVYIFTLYFATKILNQTNLNNMFFQSVFP